MKNTFFVFGCVSFFIAGCSPKVMTEVVKSYPVTRAYDVRLFEAKDTLLPWPRCWGVPLWRSTESDVETMVKVETASGWQRLCREGKIFVFHGTVVQDGWLHVTFPGYASGSGPGVWAGLPRIVFGRIRAMRS